MLLHKSFTLKSKSNYALLALAESWLKANPEYILDKDIYWEFKLTGTRHILLELFTGQWIFQYVAEFKLKDSTCPAVSEHVNTAPAPANTIYDESAAELNLSTISEMLFCYYSKKGIEPDKFERLIKNGFMKPNNVSRNTYIWTNSAHNLALKFKQTIEIK